MAHSQLCPRTQCLICCVVPAWMMIPARTIPTKNGSRMFACKAILRSAYLTQSSTRAQTSLPITTYSLFISMTPITTGDSKYTSGLTNSLASLKQQTQHKSVEMCAQEWYQHTHRKFIKDPDKQFLLLLIFYIDETGTNVFQQYPLEPLNTKFLSVHSHLQ